MSKVGVLTYAFAAAIVIACGPGDVPGTRPGGSGPSGSIPGVGGSAGGGPRTPPDAAVEVGTFFEEVVEADPAPLPIAGGTVAIIAQGTKAAISDPDNDQIVVVELESMKVATTIPLAQGDDPGRLVEDSAGRLHVALRAGRGVAVVDPTAGSKLGRLPVCALPRGLAYDYFADTVHVACAGGELVSYTASNGNVLRTLRLERDLRDVVVDGDHLLVSRFRAAELLVVQSDGRITDRLSPTGVLNAPPNPGTRPSVAWRTIAAPNGGALMVHQMMQGTPVDVGGGGYGGGCRRIVTTAVSWLRTDRTGWMVDAIPTVLPVDVATDASQVRVAVPSAGRTPSSNFGGGPLYAMFSSPTVGTRMMLSSCGGPFPVPAFVDGAPEPTGRVVAVAFDSKGRLALQTRAPGMFHLGTRAVALPGRARKHTGHELFHLATASGIACASCHPEGRDDGQVWNFASLGPRRTQSVAGGISGTEPFHWSGDMPNFLALVDDVFGGRMSGPHIAVVHADSLRNWIDTIPRLPPSAPSDADAAARGQALFNDPSVGCATCHSGARLTNNQTVNVGSGGSFQVPSLLGVAWRAPFMHQGCAPTLNDRFGACGGGDGHGQTSRLTAEQRADLVAYLETL